MGIWANIKTQNEIIMNYQKEFGPTQIIIIKT